jgi:hypothetical protein
MRSTEDLRIKLPIVLRGDGACIYLSADLDTLMVCEIDVFDKKVGVERKVIRIVPALPPSADQTIPISVLGAFLGYHIQIITISTEACLAQWLYCLLI